MKIQVAGPGCFRCQTTEKNVFNACAELDLAADISHVHDVREFAAIGGRDDPDRPRGRESRSIRQGPHRGGAEEAVRVAEWIGDKASGAGKPETSLDRHIVETGTKSHPVQMGVEPHALF